MSHAERELILDADLPRSLRVELRARGYNATNLYKLGWEGLKDVPMLEAVTARSDPGLWVLITSDDKMPKTHWEAIQRLGVTIATVDGRWQGLGYKTQDPWRRDTIHRWAHRMIRHDDKDIRRYSPTSSATWKRRHK